MTTCFLGSGRSPAGVGGLQLNDVDLLVFVGSRQHTTLWCLWLHVAAQVVQRQELGINLASVRKQWIWKRKSCLRYWLGVLWGYNDPPKEKYGFLLPHTTGRSEPGSATEQQPCFWEISVLCLGDFSRVDVWTVSMLTSPHSPAALVTIVLATTRHDN